jgi:hypothetical protein
MNLTTITSRMAAATVAAVAGIISYGHIRSVASMAGESNLAAALLPLGIDGLIVVGTMAMLNDKRLGRRPRPSARFALGFGIVATIAGNIASAEPTWTARAVAAVPAISFLVAVEVTARTGRKAATEPDIEPAEPEQAAPRSPRQRTAGKRTAEDRVRAVRLRHPDATQAEVAKRAKVSVRTAARYWRASGPDTVPDAEPDRRQRGGVPDLAEAGVGDV